MFVYARVVKKRPSLEFLMQTKPWEEPTILVGISLYFLRGWYIFFSVPRKSTGQFKFIVRSLNDFLHSTLYMTLVDCAASSGAMWENLEMLMRKPLVAN